MATNNAHPIASQVQKHKEFFNRTVSCFLEEDAGFQPRPDMLSVVGHINHITGALELMLSGVFREFDRFKDRQCISKRPGGTWATWDMECFKDANQDPEQTDHSLRTAVQAFNETMDIVQEVFVSLTPEELMKPLAPNPMHFITPSHILHGGIFDHTTHHRGGLAQYARLCGREPKIPYFEMSEAMHEAQIEAAS